MEANWKMEADWKLKSIHEQFRVFKTLRQPYKSIPCNALTEPVKRIIDEHFVLKKKDQTQFLTDKDILPKAIVNTIIQTVTKIDSFQMSKQIHFCFIVIVNHNLSKIPIFVIEFAGKRIFIDFTCTVYHSWKGFIKNNNWPKTTFCLPTNGMYNVGNKLEIDFSYSPSLFRHKLMLWGGIIVSAGIIATTWFFSLPSISFSFINILVQAAEKFIGRSIFTELMTLTTRILQLIEKIREGESMTTILVELNEIFRVMNTQFNETISEVWEDLKDCVNKVCKYVKSKVSSFEKASKPAQNRFLAIISAIDGKVAEINEDFEQLTKVKGTSDNFDKKSNQMNFFKQSMTVDDESTSYKNKIFQNCIEDCAMTYGGCKNLDETTRNLMVVTEQHFAKQYSLDKFSNFLITVSQLVLDVYHHDFNNYKNSVNAARLAGKHESDFNLDLYNKHLGIEGPLENHFWKQAIHFVSSSSFCTNSKNVDSIEKKKEEIESEQGVLLCQVLKKPGNVNLGLFRCNGRRGRGKFSSGDLLSVIKEKIHFNEDELVVTESGDLFIIQCGKLIIVTQQVVDEDGNSEGFALIEEV